MAPRTSVQPGKSPLPDEKRHNRPYTTFAARTADGSYPRYPAYPAYRRILIGVDGSPYAEAVVGVVAKRNWPTGSESRVISVHSPFTLLALHHFVHPVSVAAGRQTDEGALVQEIVDTAALKLRPAGLSASPLVKEGDPKQVLVDEAKEWGASCIFVGAKGLRGVERFLTGSVSASVAARAHCSVEVIRI